MFSNVKASGGQYVVSDGCVELSLVIMVNDDLSVVYWLASQPCIQGYESLQELRVFGPLNL